jgi:molybdenum cofactor cytidylyltransferase
MAGEVTGLLLAAGRGVRFDPTGRIVKLLTPTRRGPHAGEPLAAASARTLIAAMPRVVAIVRPADSDAQRQLHAVLRSEGCDIAVCDDADTGISASIRRGVAACSPGSHWVIALADMPAIQPATVRAVVDALEEGAMTAAPFYKGQRGHPVGFAAALRSQLLALAGDTGARAIFDAFPPERIEVDDPGILIDVDTTEAQ